MLTSFGIILSFSFFENDLTKTNLSVHSIVKHLKNNPKHSVALKKNWNDLSSLDFHVCM